MSEHTDTHSADSHGAGSPDTDTTDAAADTAAGTD